MVSRIILSSADFSANNIGKVVDLSELTKKVLAKQTQYSEDSPQATALDNFLAACQSNGFLGDNGILKYLVIPALAGSNSELLYNIASLDANGYPTNTMNAAEIAASDKELVMLEENNVNVGVKAVYLNLDTTVEVARMTTQVDGVLTSGETYPDFCFGMYLKSTLGMGANSRILRFGGSYNCTIYKDRVMLGNSTNYVKGTYAFSNGFIGIMYDSTGSFRCVNGDSVISGTIESANVSSIVVSNSSVANYNDFTLGAPLSSQYSTFKASAMFCGNGMTNAQMQTFQGLLNTLLTSLNALN